MTLFRSTTTTTTTTTNTVSSSSTSSTLLQRTIRGQQLQQQQPEEEEEEREIETCRYSTSDQSPRAMSPPMSSSSPLHKLPRPYLNNPRALVLGALGGPKSQSELDERSHNNNNNIDINNDRNPSPSLLLRSARSSLSAGESMLCSYR